MKKSFFALTQRGAFIDLMEFAHYSPANRLIDVIIKKLCGEFAVPPHPLFGSLSLLDPVMVKSEFLSTRTRMDAMMTDQEHTAMRSCDLYAVVREARGWSARQPHHINLIVRDLLWLRPSPKVAREAHIDTHEQGEVIGFYYSAYDNDCLWISRMELQGHNAILTGRTRQLGDNAQWMTLIFPLSPYSHPLQIRDGILSGFAGDSRNLGAWKLLLIKPDWEFTRQLEAVFAQLETNDTRKINQICSESGAVGALFSELRGQDDAKVQLRQEAFLRLMLTETDFPGLGKPFETFLTREIGKILSDVFSGDSSDTVETVLLPTGLPEAAITNAIGEIITEKFINFVQDNRELFEPAQIITFRQRSIAEEQIADTSRARVERLLELPAIRVELLGR